ncbi:MAG: aminoglycoside phosphotransferase [Sideroxydans sp. GWF2_59_14]|nr:MAG: aminoglycoside phosphotransferase [Sideroxydans sp. GWF2_59_14]HAF44375.1 aminoglycoside phosphotransferase [Gallionellaceae bacterium]
MQRQQQLTDWLSSLYPNEKFIITPASADASFRRYFRATFADGSTKVVMDAPPQHEDCKPFLHVGKLFEDAGTHVPHVYAQDLAQGFLLLSDLGNTTYLQALDKGDAKQLYGAATDALIKIQLASKPKELPPYDEALLRRELNLFPEWYIAKHLGVTLSDKQKAKLEEVFARILRNNLAQPCVYVHRDYHSRNLMVTEENNPGIIDFQDAVYGPITYDLASLFKDAYIRWEEDEVMDWLIRHWEKARKAGLPVREDFGEFYRDYEMMGVQRHIKVLGIFARLYHRDGKDGYLKDMPLVMEYLVRACERYIDLKPLHNLLIELDQHAAKAGATS